MPLLETVKTLFSGGKIVETIGKVADELHFSNEEKAKLQAELLKLEADIEKQYLEDTANARDMQKTALAQDDKFAKRFIYYLAAFVLITTIGFGVVLCFVPIPEANRRLVEMFFDVFLFSGALSVLYFFFGSSHGSQRKTDIIKSSINNNQ